MTANRLPTADEVANKPSPPPAPPGAGMYLPAKTVAEIEAAQAAARKAVYDETHVTPKNPYSLEVRNKDDRRKVAFLLGRLREMFDRSTFVLPDADLRAMQGAEVDILGRRLLGDAWDNREIKT